MISPEYSVIIPVLDEEESLPVLQEKISSVMKECGSEYEIIYIDDFSRDNSLNILKSIKEKDPRVKAYSFENHRGQSAALCAGVRLAKGNWIITLDADLQNPPEEITKLLVYKNEYDFITGIRERRQDSFIRIVSSRTAWFFRRAVLKDYTKDVGCSLRCFRKEVGEAFPFFRNFHRFFPYLAGRLGFRIKEVQVKHFPRKFGRSKYGTLNRLGQGLFDLIGVFWLSKRIFEYRFRCENS